MRSPGQCPYTYSNSVSLAATWDGKMIKELCEMLVAEAKSKEVDVLLGPTGKLSVPFSPIV